ncbi:MAG: DNA methyltransferase [Candidatus Doudnabacteria bacterium]
MIDIWLTKESQGSYEHPTQKPVSLFERPLLRRSKPGDNIFIGFGGSGSELLACEQLKRKAFVIEQSPIFTQLIINRYEELTGQKAKKLN